MEQPANFEAAEYSYSTRIRFLIFAIKPKNDVLHRKRAHIKEMIFLHRVLPLGVYIELICNINELSNYRLFHLTLYTLRICRVSKLSIIGKLWMKCNGVRQLDSSEIVREMLFSLTICRIVFFHNSLFH